MAAKTHRRGTPPRPVRGPFDEKAALTKAERLQQEELLRRDRLELLAFRLDMYMRGEPGFTWALVSDALEGLDIIPGRAPLGAAERKPPASPYDASARKSKR